MGEEPLSSLLSQLQGAEAGPIVEAIRRIGQRLRSLDASGLRLAAASLCELFYIDLFDRPDLQPAVDLAEQTLVEAGEPVIPFLIAQMEGSDIKSHLHLATVLGGIGPAALPFLRRLIATADDPYGRSFALYAAGKIRSTAVHEALPEVTGALMHPDKEVRDSAARTLGKIVEVVPASLLSDRRRAEIYGALCRAVGDAQPAVRAKAVRSLGKLAQRGYLDASQRRELKGRLEALLARGEETDWDHAFIVRRQVKEALAHLASVV